MYKREEIIKGRREKKQGEKRIFFSSLLASSQVNKNEMREKKEMQKGEKIIMERREEAIM